jgi:uncharacterized OB-fold protein
VSEPRTIELQTCAECGYVQYPEREVCGRCLSSQIAPGAVEPRGHVVSWTLLHASSDPWVRERGPWRIGLIALDSGPVLYAHLAEGLGVGQRVEIAAVSSPHASGVWLAWKAGAQMPAALQAAVQGT